MHMKTTINKKYFSFLLYLASIAAVCLVFVFLVTVNIIGYGVKDTCQDAKEQYSGDCVEALTQYLDDDSNSFRTRNSAVWALGQLGDDRALPTLQKHYTHFDGERADRTNELSQLELERAIGYMDGSPNITTFFWRFGEDIE